MKGNLVLWVLKGCIILLISCGMRDPGPREADPPSMRAGLGNGNPYPLVDSIPTPRGYHRVVESGHSFGSWLRLRSPAMIVLDMAEDAMGRRIYMLAQSYMPAQDVHIVKNPGDTGMSPWYIAGPGSIETPEWSFTGNQLRTWPRAS